MYIAFFCSSLGCLARIATTQGGEVIRENKESFQKRVTNKGVKAKSALDIIVTLDDVSQLKWCQNSGGNGSTHLAFLNVKHKICKDQKQN